MYRIDTEKFNQTLQLLIGYIIGAQEKNHCDNPTKIDFHSGWLCEQEGYKRYIWHEAQKILKCNEWLENDLPGRDITNRVLKCMNIKIETGKPQNLLYYTERMRYERILEEKPQEVEDLIRRIYCSPDEEKAFRQGCALFGKQYPLMAFLFFSRVRVAILPGLSGICRLAPKIWNRDLPGWASNPIAFPNVHGKTIRSTFAYLMMCRKDCKSS